MFSTICIHPLFYETVKHTGKIRMAYSVTLTKLLLFIFFLTCSARSARAAHGAASWEAAYQ